MSLHKLRALEYLVAVIEHGGFAAAGRRLGVAAPSVHRLVGALETELGLPLLDRSVSPMRPTPDALRYVERARRLLGELEGLDASLRDRATSPTGVVALAGHAVAIEFVLSRVLPSFLERCPGVGIDLRDAGIERDLGRLDADLLLMFGWPPPQDALLRTLAYTRWLVVAAPSFWSAHGMPTHPADLSALPCVLFRTPYGEVLRQWSFVRGDERVDVDVDGRLVGDHRTALDAPVAAGQMVARINDLTAPAGLRDGGLQPVLLDWQGLHAPPLNLLVRKSVARQPRVRVLVDHLVRCAEEMGRQRLPAGLPPVRASTPPDWFRKRVRR